MPCPFYFPLPFVFTIRKILALFSTANNSSPYPQQLHCESRAKLLKPNFFNYCKLSLVNHFTVFKYIAMPSKEDKVPLIMESNDLSPLELRLFWE